MDLAYFLPPPTWPNTVWLTDCRLHKVTEAAPPILAGGGQFYTNTTSTSYTSVLWCGSVTHITVIECSEMALHSDWRVTPAPPPLLLSQYSIIIPTPHSGESLVG